MKRTLALVAGVALLGLAACGTSPGDRAASGGLIGAGTGAAAGALLGNPLAGAVVGGAVGAGTGLLTSPDSVQLGRPAWR
jgi:osmotically inducible lipoprotein OsmB